MPLNIYFIAPFYDNCCFSFKLLYETKIFFVANFIHFTKKKVEYFVEHKKAANLVYFLFHFYHEKFIDYQILWRLNNHSIRCVIIFVVFSCNINMYTVYSFQLNDTNCRHLSKYAISKLYWTLICTKVFDVNINVTPYVISMRLNESTVYLTDIYIRKLRACL